MEGRRKCLIHRRASSSVAWARGVCEATLAEYDASPPLEEARWLARGMDNCSITATQLLRQFLLKLDKNGLDQRSRTSKGC